MILEIGLTPKLMSIVCRPHRQELRLILLPRKNEGRHNTLPMQNIKYIRYFIIVYINRVFDQSQFEGYASLQDAEQLAPKNSCNDPRLVAAD